MHLQGLPASTRSEPGEAGTELVPDLATEVPTPNGGISADGKTYTFQLRQGVKFQPPVSREVTAADFKWSFERMMRLPTRRRRPSTWASSAPTGLHERQGRRDHRLQGRRRLHRRDHARAARRLVPQHAHHAVLYVVPKEWVAKWGKQFNRHPLGTGPFVIQSWTPGRRSCSPGTRTTGSRARPYLDQWVYDFSSNPHDGAAHARARRGRRPRRRHPAADLVRVKTDPSGRSNLASSP